MPNAHSKKKNPSFSAGRISCSFSFCLYFIFSCFNQIFLVVFRSFISNFFSFLPACHVMMLVFLSFRHLIFRLFFFSLNSPLASFSDGWSRLHTSTKHEMRSGSKKYKKKKKKKTTEFLLQNEMYSVIISLRM